MPNPNMANREVCDLVLCDYNTQRPVLAMDYANTTTTNVTGEAVYAYGGWSHPTRVTFTGNKGGTLVVETQIQPFKLYGILSGAAIQKTAKFLHKETVTVTEDNLQATLPSAPVGPVNVFAHDDLETVVEATVEGTAVTLPAAGEYDVYYVEEIKENVQKLNINNTTFPKAFTIYGNTIYKTEDDELLPFKMIYYKASPQSNFTITNSNTGDPTSLSITFDLMVNTDGDLMDMLLIEEDQSAL